MDKLDNITNKTEGVIDQAQQIMNDLLLQTEADQLTVRDQFAISAMNALINNEEVLEVLARVDEADAENAFVTVVTRGSYQLADAMLEARGGGKDEI